MDTFIITQVEISDKDLFEGAKVRNKRSGLIRTIKSIPSDKTIYQCVVEGIFDPTYNVDFQTVMNNKHLFELVEEY